MKLKDLIKVFIYGERVTIMGTPCGWCEDALTEIFVEKDDIPEAVKPYLDNEVISVETEMVNGGYCCGEPYEIAVIEITIK